MESENTKKMDYSANHVNEKCTGFSVGAIVSFNKYLSLENSMLITVEYEVDGKTYRVSEPVGYETRMKKFLFIPFKSTVYYWMGSTSAGSPASVSYNPDNPSEAFLLENYTMFDRERDKLQS